MDPQWKFVAPPSSPEGWGGQPVEVSSVRVSLHMGVRPLEEEKVIVHARGSRRCPSRGVRRTLEGPRCYEPPVEVLSVRVSSAWDFAL